MIKCPKCGREIPEEANFCPYCMEKFVGKNEPQKLFGINKSKELSLIIGSCIITGIICIFIFGIINAGNVKISDDNLQTSGNEATEDSTANSLLETTTIDYLNPDRFGPNFTEDSTLAWPVQGDIIMGFSVNETVYYKTQDWYAISEGIMIQADIGTPVYCAADCTISQISVDERYGIYVKTDLGNDYLLYYGQLKEVELKSGETLKKGELIGYVNRPSEYFKLEESHLYLRMIKKGKAVDPVNYLER